MAEETFWQKITGGFKSNLKDLGEDIENLVVWIITSSPYLLVYALFGFGVVTGIKAGRKKVKARKQKKTTPPEQTEE